VEKGLNENMIVTNYEIYDLEKSIKASKYPM
jgi:hypothetical protein